MNRAQRRAEAKAAKKKAVHPVIKAAQGACALFAQLAMCRPRDAGPIPGDLSDLASYALEVQTKSINNARAAQLRLLEQTTDSSEDAMIICEALGVTAVRAVEIAGPNASSNPLLAAIHSGQRALQTVTKRWERCGKWEMLQAEADAIDYAIALYVDVMQNSTPQQMEDAVGTRRRMIEMARNGTI